MATNVSTHLHGESVSEEFNYVVPLDSTYPTLVTLLLTRNQVPWKTYFRRNLRRKNNENDKFEKESTNSYIDSKVGENVGSKNDRAFTSSLASITIPKNIHFALKYPELKTAVVEEKRALEEKNLVSLHTSQGTQDRGMQMGVGSQVQSR
ncbi:reverse transcriptase [Cucumis melo var. makuwa]|uniref:Reverse transcriptase n=1 Tax=Cucumis melo var. makuwa TaxID=1194695 RepID=A0A5A7VAS4_CUCMM|nr:reverse transcriptase [Cucumis melo var. makuwa]